MFLTPRRFLVIFITILQLFIPLVHAHEGEQFLKLGLHVPGLENYGAMHEGSFAKITAIQHNDSAEGMIVAVGLGFKQKQINPLAIAGSQYFIHQNFITLNTAALKFDVNYSPQYKRFSSDLIQENSPRAPPRL